MEKKLKEIKQLLVKAIELIESEESKELEGQISMDELIEEDQLSIEEMRRILAAKSRAGFTEDIRNLLLKYGAKKLSAIDPSKYKDLVNDVEALK